MKKINRREFLRLTTLGIGGAIVLNALGACAGFSSNRRFETNASFTHGVASGDPLSTQVILWTRALPSDTKNATVTIQLALDKEFTQAVYEQGSLSTNIDKDYTLKFDIINLEPDTIYYYRFLSKDNISPIGRTKTLPIGAVKQVKLLTVSCSYYSAGYFNVYKEVSKEQDVDAVLHLGDYIYEYGPGVFADNDALSIGRVMQPAKEILVLDDYRQRYAQTRSDEDCQAFHAAHPLIAIWDDHEITNDSWNSGAENHSSDEGDFDERRLAALQAYVEWMPIRPPVEKDLTSIQRSFEFGDLVNLSLMDTRLAEREQQLNFVDFMHPKTGVFDGDNFFKALHQDERELIGKDQLNKLTANFLKPSKWQVIAQQVLMGKMYLPAPLVTLQVSNDDYGNLVYKAKNTPKQLSQQELAVLNAPNIPYNLDAWDGYPAERIRVLNLAKKYNVNLVVLTGDTHNAWMNDLYLDDEKIGVELACPSVTSPGFEEYVGSTEKDEPATVAAIEGLQYCNLLNRGYMTATFTHHDIKAEWNFVDTVKSKEYLVLNERKHAVVLSSRI